MILRQVFAFLLVCCAAFPMVAVADESPVPARFMDRLDVFFEPYPGHRVVERHSEEGYFTLVTLPEGETTEQWTSRFTIRVSPAVGEVPQEGIQALMAAVEQPYVDTCPIDLQFYMLDSLSYLVDDEHPARTLLTGCGQLETPAGPRLEATYSRVIAGPQGRFIVQWSERIDTDEGLTHAEAADLRALMNHLDPFAGAKVRAVVEAAQDAFLRDLLN